MDRLSAAVMQITDNSTSTGCDVAASGGADAAMRMAGLTHACTQVSGLGGLGGEENSHLCAQVRCPNQT